MLCLVKYKIVIINLYRRMRGAEKLIEAYRVYVDGRCRMSVAIEKSYYYYSYGYTMPSTWENKVRKIYPDYESFSIYDVIAKKHICGSVRGIKIQCQTMP